MTVVVQPRHRSQPSAGCPLPLHEDTGGRLARILPLLACPACRAGLERADAGRLDCLGCGATYPVRDGVPILLPATMQEPGVGSADADDPVSRHPYSPKALEIINAQEGGWVLDLGAGGKLQRWSNVLQVDIFRYPMTDVVATADCMPFKDNTFHAVISQAVFEHLQYPEAAAAEIGRVLQPQGTLRIDTAFLQPEHGYPHHFYNATETGLRHWFRDFDIEWSGVDAYQHPQWSLSWFLGVYLDRLPPPQAALLRTTATGDLLSALLRASEGCAETVDQPILAALAALPAHELRTLAAGVSIQGRNPVKQADGHTHDEGSSARRLVGPDATGQHIRLTRQLGTAREELADLRRQLERAHETQTIAVDRANYMAQWALFHIDLNALPSMRLPARARFALSALARLVLSPRRWLYLRAARHERQFSLPRGQIKAGAEEPTLTIVVAPDNTNAFIKAFFALAHQTYPAWELLVLEYPGQPAGVRHMLYDLLNIDERVRALSAPGQDPATRLHHAHQHARARHVLNLPNGVLPAFRMAEVFHTVQLASPQARVLMADFERTREGGGAPLRCYTLPLEGVPLANHETFGLALHVLPERGTSVVTGDSQHALVHVPEVLFRLEGAC